MGLFGGDSDQTTKKITKITTDTRTRIGDIGLTGKDFSNVASDLTDSLDFGFRTVSDLSDSQRTSAAEVGRTQRAISSDQRGAIGSIAGALRDSIQSGFRAVTDISETASQSNVAQSRAVSDQAGAVATQAAATAPDAQTARAAAGANFGGFDLTTVSLVLAAVAATFTIARSL